MNGWTCDNVGTVRFQGYASPSTKAEMSVSCAPDPAGSSTGGLPFTGLDLALIVIYVVALLLMGMLLRWVGRRKEG